MTNNNLKPLYFDHDQDIISKYKFVAKIAFVIFFFFSLFGTGLPFQIRDTANPVLEDISTSNIINQILFVILFLLALFSLIPKTQSLVFLIKKEKFLFIFLLWCLISIIWSNDRFVSFKRLFQIITGILVILSFLFHTNTASERIRPIQFILIIYLFLSIIACLTINGAKDPAFDTWRGFADTKNQLGQISVACFLLSAIAYKYQKSKIYLQLIMLFLSFLLLIGSQSGTSIISLAIILIINMFIWGDKIYHKLHIGNAITLLFFFTLTFFMIVIFILDSDFLKTFPLLIGKDLTFTGRTELWQDLIFIAGKHLFFGVGYQSFWTKTNPDAISIYDLYIWIPNQAHNGYIDLLISIGIIGLLLLLFIVIKFLIINSQIHIENPWKWLFLAVLIINFQESTIFRPGNFTGVMFILSYLITMKDYYLPNTISED